MFQRPLTVHTDPDTRQNYWEQLKALTLADDTKLSIANSTTEGNKHWSNLPVDDRMFNIEKKNQLHCNENNEELKMFIKFKTPVDMTIT